MNKLSPIHGAKKIGIIGTNSAGKSTLAYEILWRLKKAGVIADGVIQQDRRLGFKSEYLDTNILAQYSLLSRQMMVEADMCMGDGVEMIVTDRTPFDLYCYYESVFGGSPFLEVTLKEWMYNTYEKIYMLRPVAYEKTPARQPTEAFRDKVHKIILAKAEAYIADGGKNMEIEPPDYLAGQQWRKQLPYDVIALAGKSSKLGLGAANIIVGTLKQDVLIGGSYATGRASVKSDLDIHVMNIAVAQENKHALEEVLHTDVELLAVPNKEVWEYLKTQGFLEFKGVQDVRVSKR